MGYFVSDTYRTNSLSLVPGGSVVIINEVDGTTKAYDKVKNPNAYINAILKKNSRIETIYVDNQLVWTKSK